jgi:hypothetical protein
VTVFQAPENSIWGVEIMPFELIGREIFNRYYSTHYLGTIIFEKYQL